MKNYTDIEQAKKLAEILPLESADTCYSNDGTSIKIDANPYTVRYSMWKDCVVEIIPCWSLAALLSLLPRPSLHQDRDGKWYCDAEPNRLYFSSHYDNPIDACYEMILKLNELNCHSYE